MAPTPPLEIGVVEGPEAYQFHGIAGAIRLSDGRIVVADGASREIRSYDPAGRHLATAGGRGEGSGEFDALSLLALAPGDTIVAYDSGLRRVSYFDPGSAYLRAVTLPDHEGRPTELLGVLDDGRLLITVPLQSTRLAIAPTAGAHLVPDSLCFIVWSPETETADTLGVFPGWDAVIDIQGAGDRITAITVRKPPFTRYGFGGVAAGGRAFAATGDYEIVVFDGESRMERRIRPTVPPEPVSRAYLDRLWEHQRPPDATDQPNPYLEMPLPDALPAIAGAQSDAAGRVWIERFRWPGEDPSVWDIFDPAGRIVAVVHAPPGFTVHDIGADYILGVATDELGVERVRLYPLARD